MSCILVDWVVSVWCEELTVSVKIAYLSAVGVVYPLFGGRSFSCCWQEPIGLVGRPGQCRESCLFVGVSSLSCYQ